MLVELRIKDYAIIQDLTVTPGAGLNVFSGETGAGKSIIVGALSLLLGERASAQSVRAGADRAVVEAAFDVSDLLPVLTLLDEMGYSAEDGLLILRREVAREGRNRAWINGSPATAAAVGQLGLSLVDLHGQHEHQSLLRPADQREILDRFAGAQSVAARTRNLWEELSLLRDTLEAKRERVRELEARNDFLRFQIQEIEAADPRPGEEEALEEEARRLEHAVDLARGAQVVAEALYAGERSVTEMIADAKSTLERLSRIDPKFEGPARELEDLYHRASELGQGLERYASGLDPDPARLEEIRARMDLLFRLKRKYGPELSDVLATRRRVQEELAELDGSTLDLKDLEERVELARGAFEASAGELSGLRQEGAGRLAAAVEAVLPHLGLPHGRFEVRLPPLPQPGSAGREKVEFMVALNPGFEPAPLARVASGGELSRVMLALKAILALEDKVPTLIFDEIDSGIGGEVALQVAEKLKQVSGHHQVFVITHLPQIAARADHQLLVEKTETGEGVSTRVTPLEGDARVREVARMLGGDADSEVSRAHARALLGLGGQDPA